MYIIQYVYYTLYIGILTIIIIILKLSHIYTKKNIYIEDIIVKQFQRTQICLKHHVNSFAVSEEKV